MLNKLLTLLKNWLLNRRRINLLTLSETAELLNVHPNSLRKWDKKGILRAVRIGERGDRKYRKQDIDKLIKSN